MYCCRGCRCCPGGLADVRGPPPADRRTGRRLVGFFVDAGPGLSHNASPVSQSTQHEQRHFFGQAKVMAALTVLSRIAGMLRAMAIASLGANALTDAFAMAWRIPNLFRRLFAEGALSAAFVPVFTETLESGPQGLPRGLRLLANAMALLTVLLLGILLVTLAGLLLWGWLWPGAADRQLMILLASLMLPFMVTVCLLALGSAALNCRGHFAYPAATPILMNLIIVAAAWFVSPRWQDPADKLAVVAVSVSLAGVVQFVGVLWLLKRMGLALPWRLRPLEPGIRPMLKLMAPMLLALGFLQTSELLQSILAWVLRKTPGQNDTFAFFGWQLTKPLDTGVLQRIDAARYLYQFPLGVLAISLGVAVFPLLSRYAARGDMPNFRDSLNRALRLSMMEGLATGAGLLVLAEPITWLLYRHGNYTADDVRQSAFIVQMYAAGMWAYCSYQILVRAFYSLKDTTTPLKISCVLAAAHMVLVAALLFTPLGAAGFGLATAVTFAVNALWLAAKLRKRLGLFGGRKLAVSVARSTLASAVMAAAVLALQGWLAGQGARNWLVVAACVPAGAGVFVLAAWALRAPELGELWGAVKTKATGKADGL